MARLAGPVWACCPSAFFDPAANALEVFEKTHGRRTVVDVASCGGRNMVSFQFQRDQQVKVRATGKVGTISSTTGNSLADSEGRQATVPNRKIGKLQDGYEANFLVWIATRLRTWTT